MSPPNLQQGYALLLFILTLFMASSVTVYYGTLPQANQLKHQQTQQQMALLNQVKTNLLLYATSTHEIYATNTNGNFYTAELVTAPGYFPCPDTNNNGSTNTPCGGATAYTLGRLPDGIATRHFRFIDNRASPTFIWYVIDSRYVIQNTYYNNASIKRYSPLNTNMPGNGKLKLDNQSNLVAILFISAQVPPENTDLETLLFNNLIDANQNLFTRANALTLTISHSEWNNAVRSRSRQQAKHYCDSSALISHWFNLNWRNLLC